LIAVYYNTNARAISNVTLANEYNTPQKVFQCNKHHIKFCNLAAIDCAFAANEVRATIHHKIEPAYW
jgi:hypothetical protein